MARMTGQKSKSPKGSGTARPSVRHLSIIKSNDTWETPSKLLWDFFHKANIYPELDVCTTKTLAKRLKFPFFYTKQDTALKREWVMDFFMNPPYSQIGNWIAYANTMTEKHGVRGICLTYAKTDTKWWHLFVEDNPNAEVHFIKGRIKFDINGKPSKNSAPYPSVWIIFKGSWKLKRKKDRPQIMEPVT